MPYLRPRFFRNPQMMNKRAIRRTMPSVDASLSYINWPTTKGEACLIPIRQRRTSICTDAFTSSSDACRPGRGMFATLLPLRSSRAPLLALRLPFLSEIRPADLAADVTRLSLPGLFSASCRRSTYRRYTVPHPSLAILSFSHFPHRSSWRHTSRRYLP